LKNIENWNRVLHSVGLLGVDFHHRILPRDRYVLIDATRISSISERGLVFAGIL
jgi:hypothetical protein